jgi:hypothetical protein
MIRSGAIGVGGPAPDGNAGVVVISASADNGETDENSASDIGSARGRSGRLWAMSAIRRIGLVMMEGIVYYPAELHEATGIKAFSSPVPAMAAKR